MIERRVVAIMTHENHVRPAVRIPNRVAHQRIGFAPQQSIENQVYNMLHQELHIVPEFVWLAADTVEHMWWRDAVGINDSRFPRIKRDVVDESFAE